MPVNARDEEIIPSQAQLCFCLQARLPLKLHNTCIPLLFYQVRYTHAPSAIGPLSCTLPWQEGHRLNKISHTPLVHAHIYAPQSHEVPRL